MTRTLATLTALLTLIATPAIVSAATISYTLDDISVNPTDTVGQIDIIYSASEAFDVTGVDLMLTYDPSLVMLTDVSLGDGIPDFTEIAGVGLTSPEPGKTGVTGSNLFATVTIPAATDSVYASLTYELQDAGFQGVIPITLEPVTAGFQGGDDPEDDASGGSITVVPEPASAVLISLGGLALVARRRRA